MLAPSWGTKFSQRVTFVQGARSGFFWLLLPRALLPLPLDVLTFRFR